MKKIEFFLTATAVMVLAQPLSAEAKEKNYRLEDVLSKASYEPAAMEETTPRESKTAFKVQAVDESWMFRMGLLRLLAKKEKTLERVMWSNQWKEPTHGIGVSFTRKF